jgi:hypothetical protein
MNLQRMTPAHAKRPVLVGAALLCFAAAAILTPSDVRSQLDIRPRDSLTPPEPRIEPPLTPVVPAGDAFAPRVAVEDDSRPVAPLPALALPHALPHAVSVLPRAVPITRVTAIATGSHPTAIIESDRFARVVTIGDPVAGSAVAAIDDDGIQLANGRRLAIEPTAPTP